MNDEQVRQASNIASRRAENHRASDAKRPNPFQLFIIHHSSFIVPLLLVFVPFAFLFGPALVRGEVFVYRDAAHFYYPLFEWTAREWASGRIPLWNPQENCGVPVLGEATSSVFYPGKLIFALPLTSFGMRYMLYIVGHVAFAAWAAYFVARRWGASPPAATACAVSYALGGSVLFQIYNVVFLVSAAWLPLAFFFAERMLAERSWKQAALLGVTLAMMVLGGDPQTAYHAGLLAVLYAGILSFADRSCRERPPWRSTNGQNAPIPKSRNATEGVPYRRRTSRVLTLLRHVATTRPVLLGVAAIIGALLSAVQILPALEWNKASDRAYYERPRSIYEACEYLETWLKGERYTGHRPAKIAKEIAIGLGGTPESGTHQEAIYDYSQSPWRLAEAVWPNISGRPFPVNRRWISAIPAEGRSWTPSIYAGLLPLLLALGNLRFRKGAPRVRWLSWTLLLCVLASLGWYGLGWVWHEIHAAWTGEQPDVELVGSPTGGLYWLLVGVLPGYAQFRYPAKWLVPAALALSLLAAQGWDRAFSARPTRMRWSLGMLGLVSAGGLVAAFVLRTHWAELVGHAADDDYFGPLDAMGSWRDLTWAFGQTALLCGLFWWLLGRVAVSNLPNASDTSPTRQRGVSRALATPRLRVGLVLGNLTGHCSWRYSLSSWIALAITLAELTLAQSALIATAPNDLWTTSSPLAARMVEQDARDGVLHYRVFRTSAEHWPVPELANDSSRSRQVENARWERETLFPKYHLLEKETPISLVESSGTMKSHHLVEFMAAAREHVRPKRLNLETPYFALNALSVKYIVRSKREFRDMRETWLRLREETLWYDPNAWPRANVVHDVYWEKADFFRGSAEMLILRLPFPPTAHATVESSGPLDSDNWPGNEEPKSVCEFRVDAPQHIEIDATLDRPGLLVLGDLFYPGWAAEATNEETGETTPLKIMRTNGIMRGVFLPAGKHRVTFSYRPLSFYAGAAISAAAWGALGIVAGLRLTRSQRRRRSTQAAPSPLAPG